MFFKILFKFLLNLIKFAQLNFIKKDLLFLILFFMSKLKILYSEEDKELINEDPINPEPPIT